MESGGEPMDTDDEDGGGGGGLRALWGGGPAPVQLRRLSEALRGLRWMPLAEASVSAMLQAHLRLSLRERCAGRFESCVMERQLDWIDASVLPWVSAALESGADQWRARDLLTAASVPLEQWREGTERAGA